MNETLTILACLGGVFTFAFGLAWCVPLAIAGAEERKAELKPGIKDLADLLLILNDMIPFFFLFEMIRKAPESYSAAQKLWKSDGMIRVSFYTSTLSALTTGLLLYFLL